MDHSVFVNRATNENTGLYFKSTTLCNKFRTAVNWEENQPFKCVQKLKKKHNKHI